MMRYIRAFFIALRMTLRGEGPPPRSYEALWQWIETGQQYLKSVYAAAESSGLDAAQRKALKLHIEGRDVSIHTILGAVQHHLQAEYPYLLRDLTHYSVTGIYASNMNDQFLVSRLAESEYLENEVLRGAVMHLREHLSSIPPSNSL